MTRVFLLSHKTKISFLQFQLALVMETRDTSHPPAMAQTISE